MFLCSFSNHQFFSQGDLFCLFFDTLIPTWVCVHFNSFTWRLDALRLWCSFRLDIINLPRNCQAIEGFLLSSNPYVFAMQFNRGTSAMQHYVATRPMFIDVEVMNADTRLVLGDQGSQISPSNVARGLSSLYKEITGLKNRYWSL